MPMTPSQCATQQQAPENSESCRHLTVGYYPGSKRGRTDPHLRIGGRWLEEAGFPIGGKVSVAVSPGRLIIDLVERPATPKPAIKTRKHDTAS
jgi:toxic protein SymE